MRTTAALICSCLSIAFAPALNAQEESSISPDGKWEYKCADHDDGYCLPQIVNTGTSEVVLMFVRDVNISSPLQAEVAWAPDSKRFAFNYSPPHARHTTYITIAFYELSGDKWTPLLLLEQLVLEDDKAFQAEIAHVVKKYLPKSAHRTGETLVPDILKVHDWRDANTAIAYSIWGERAKPQAALVLTLKFDNAGKWKIAEAQRMSQKQIKEEQ